MNTDPDDDNVIDLQARRRCRLERAGADPLQVAVGLWAETGDLPAWDHGYDDGDAA
ncbi:hypothetical protein AB0H76_26195 [Nocardia sp. NPDC050712]|uniref:hypothetical protein n=1 Tax=Nocardia sp. NPDC050712 TaxID=3155518 RepID=UPI00340994C7